MSEITPIQFKNPENIDSSENSIDEVTKSVYSRIHKIIEDIKGGKLYYELVEKLQLINQEHFEYLMNLQISVKVHNIGKEWEINNELHDLSLLACTYLPKFWEENMYPRNVLRDIAYLQSNLFTITKWLFSNQREIIPVLTETTSKVLIDTYNSIRLVATAKDEEDIILIKNDMICALAEILVNTSYASVYHKELSEEELKKMEWKMN